ncbi:MAG: hypothetical protein OXG04_02240 [Acidobacteria bacterium]|nr:hypothetical protein [Acidobacteriota bacterium]
MGYGIPERAVMIALMALNRETLNTELKRRYRLELKKPARDKLNREGLVQSRRLPGKGFAHELTDAGWAWVVAQLDAPAPLRTGSAGGALYALLNGLRVALDARGMVIQELFDQSEPTAPQRTGELRDRIRQAYRNLSSRPWDWVELRELRVQLGDWSRREVDLELTRMFREKDVNLTLHEDLRRLTEADRNAALRIGVDDMHLISMQ